MKIGNLKFKVAHVSNVIGFTLVELLIVVSVIGILTGLMVTVINPTTTSKKARDGIRKSNVAKLAEAVEAYNASEGSYPSSKGNLSPVYVKNDPDGRPQAGDIYNYDKYGSGSAACVWIRMESKSGCLKYRTNWGEVREGMSCDCLDG